MFFLVEISIDGALASFFVFDVTISAILTESCEIFRSGIEFMNNFEPLYGKSIFKRKVRKGFRNQRKVIL